MTPLVDHEARTRIRTDLRTTLIVEAAAGTGKTTELVQRILALLLTGETRLSSVVAVTFTEKAAGEMKLRLRAEIERARRDAGPEEHERLLVALAELEEAHIGTIHSFAAVLLRQRPIEARVDPRVEVLAEDRQSRVLSSAFDAWFQRTLAAPPEGVRRVLRRRSRDRDSPSPRDVLWKAAHGLVEQRDFDAPWRRDPFDRARSIDGVLAEIAHVGELSRRVEPAHRLGKALHALARFASDVERDEASVARDYDGLEDRLRGLARDSLWSWKWTGKWVVEGLLREDVKRSLDALRAEIERVVAACDADLAACLREDLAPLGPAYEAAKAREGCLDFLDLLLLARDLVKGDDAVRAELQGRFTHLLVDEFQDTDPLQADILLLLAADDPAERDANLARPVPGKLFIVGDPKQSIYRFRRADVAFYELTKRRLIAQGAALLHLSTSFRSAPSLQAAINASFAPLMAGSPDGSQAEYVALQPFRSEPVGQPTVIALPVPEPYSDWGRLTGGAVSKSLPETVGAFVAWLLRESGWMVTERERQGPVPVLARHVCLLTRRFVSGREDVVRPYVSALEKRRIPHVLVGGRSYHQREEIIALRSALTAIEWPDDELSVFATLRGPLFALGDDALLAFRRAVGAPHPGRRIDESLLTPLTLPVAEALRLLHRLRVGRNHRAIADTVGQLLDGTRAHAGVAIWPNGEQALANILRMQDQARRFEATRATSFRAFVDWLDEEAERRAATEAPVVEEGTDGVRLMTVYRAKGLEFPVVILIDPACGHTHRNPSRYVDATRRLWVTPLADCTPVELQDHKADLLRHDRDEAIRLTYVAATRARELLVVPAVGDGPLAGWVDPLHPALYPSLRDRRASRPAPGCPPFGEDTVLARPADTPPEDAVRPGLHRPRVGEHEVVWWDPAVLGAPPDADAGLRQQRILALDPVGVAHDAGVRRHRAWEDARASLLAAGGEPSLRVHGVTGAPNDRAPLAAESAIAVSIEATPLAGTTRPGGPRFGTLVHAVLSTVPLDAGPAEVAAVADVRGAMLGAPAEEVASAAAATVAALAHPVLVEARAAVECRRESPVLLRDPDGSLVEGALDLAYRVTLAGGPVWVVVDFKTDADLAGRQRDYERQVRTYAQAVAVATREAVRGVILRV